jgi:uncharacterized protein (DUF885 family)
MTATDPVQPTADTLAVANRVLADAWDVVRSSPFTALQIEGRITRMPDLGYDAAVASAATATALLARIDALDLDGLPAALSVPLRQARYSMEHRSHAADWYWTVIDPAGVGFYGLFLPSAYCGGHLLTMVFESLQRNPLREAGDVDRHLAMVADLVRMIEQWRERTVGQAARGMRMPLPQIPAARALAAGFATRAASLADAADDRFSDRTRPQAVALRAELRRRVEQQLQPAFTAVADLFDATYEAAAPGAVGMGQYDGGAEVYAHLVRLHTTLPLTPAEVHAAGHERLEVLEATMREIRAEVGLADDPAAYLARVHADERFRAADTDGVAEVFQRYVDRIDAAFPHAFHRGADAPHAVAPLPQAMQASMTFGYYDPPKPGQREGRFLFNSGHLTTTPLMNVAALIYHELVPGHHLHIASQQENDQLHPLSRYSFVNAFNEGWAEYAATVAGELGCYEAPEERYGRCVMEAFLTCRLVVDTGMNVMGWGLEEAREFLRAHSAMSEAEIRSETLRYSCDIPAQALAYKLGEPELLRLRAAMQTARRARGHDLDVRDFHTAVLANGAMPLPDLWREVERQLA